MNCSSSTFIPHALLVFTLLLAINRLCDSDVFHKLPLFELRTDVEIIISKKSVAGAGGGSSVSLAMIGAHPRPFSFCNHFRFTF